MLRITLKVCGVFLLIVALFALFRTVALAEVGEGTLEALPKKSLDSPSPESQRLSRAIQIPTVSLDKEHTDEAPFRKFGEFLRAEFPLLYRAIKCETVGKYSALCQWQGTSPDLLPVLLNAHFDVVPADSRDTQWNYGPFSGAMAEGYIWGRGTLDDKSSLLAILEAVQALVKQNFRLKRTVLISIGHDEEVMGKEGAGRIADILKNRGIRLEAVYDEGGSVLPIGAGKDKVVGATVGIAEKGYLSLELIAHATAGHSSMPPRETSIGMLAHAIDSLHSHPFPMRLTESSRQMLTALAPRMPLFRRLAITNLWLFGPFVKRVLATNPATNATVRTTMAPTVIQAGLKENVLPETARAIVNCRILQGESCAGVVAYVKKVVNNPHIEVRMLHACNEPSHLTIWGDSFSNKLSEGIKASFPDAVVVPYVTVAGTDSKHFQPLTSRTYRFLPIRLSESDLSRIHGINERISIQGYEAMIQYYKDLLRQMP